MTRPQVASALRLCDGALVLVDVVEGVRTQTVAVLRQVLPPSACCKHPRNTLYRGTMPSPRIVQSRKTRVQTRKTRAIINAVVDEPSDNLTLLPSAPGLDRARDPLLGTQQD
jgi:hypothetical protein